MNGDRSEYIAGRVAGFCYIRYRSQVYKDVVSVVQSRSEKASMGTRRDRERSFASSAFLFFSVMERVGVCVKNQTKRGYELPRMTDVENRCRVWYACAWEPLGHPVYE